MPISRPIGPITGAGNRSKRLCVLDLCGKVKVNGDVIAVGLALLEVYG